MSFRRSYHRHLQRSFCPILDARHETWLLLFCGFHAYSDFSSQLVNLPSGLSLCRGQCEDQRRRPVCLWGAGGEDPADSRPVGEREPGPEDPAGWWAAGWRQSLRRLLLHTLSPQEPRVHRKVIETAQRTRIKWRRGWKRSSDFRKDFCCLHTPFFFSFNRHLFTEENANNSIMCPDSGRTLF